MNTPLFKIVVGLSLVECVRTFHFDSSLNETYSELKQLYLSNEPSITEVKDIHDTLVNSSSEGQREIGFILEPLLEFQKPEKD